MNMTEHTKLPWKVVKDGTALVIYSDEYDIVGVVDTSSNQDKANAQFIVLACNAHKELLAELESAINDMESEPVQCVGDWEKGLFCGLEDRSINDIYEACRYGYDAALEKVQEWVLCSFEAAIAKAKENKL